MCCALPARLPSFMTSYHLCPLAPECACAPAIVRLATTDAAALQVEVPVEHGLLMENLLDLAHAPFTHTSTFARGWPIPESVSAVLRADTLLCAAKLQHRTPTQMPGAVHVLLTQHQVPVSACRCASGRHSCWAATGSRTPSTCPSSRRAGCCPPSASPSPARSSGYAMHEAICGLVGPIWDRADSRMRSHPLGNKCNVHATSTLGQHGAC
jgi:Vanillate O-demethylase oxygenase C-terminal domain